MSDETITSEEVAAAEAALATIKADPEVTPTERAQAMQALNELREAFRVQEQAAGRRDGLVATHDHEEG